MTTVKTAVRLQFISRLAWLAIILGLITLLSFLFGPKFGAVVQGLTPPRLPAVQQASQQVWLEEQNWDAQLRHKFHHISQGTRTLPIPLSWLLALEQPAGSLLTLPFGDKGAFTDDDYILRFGFIRGETSEQNPHGLPIGIAASPNQNLPGISGTVTAVGFNCAACHTGHFIYGNTEYVIEGGPATTDLGQLTRALGAALGQTLVSSKIPLMKGRFNRFAKKVLGDDAYLDANIMALATDLESLVNHLASLPGEVEIIEGYTRLDALNRIGNQVFALDPGKFENYVAINAPVNYPHIWTASWFDWVQYDGSIMNPLVRNTGEAMGVSAYLNTTAPEGEKRFSSSVKVDNLKWIEMSLSGTDPTANNAFNGLKAPPWPASLPPIDTAKADVGAQLYIEHCQDCHKPAPNTPAFWEHFVPVKYNYRGSDMNRYDETAQKLLQLDVIPLAQVGTDAAQSDVLVNRTVNTAGLGNSNGFSNFRGMGIDTVVCTRAPRLPADPYKPGWPADRSQAPPRYPDSYAPLVNVNISDGPAISFALALGGIVQQTNDAWFEQNYIPEDQQEAYEEGRPNCLQAGIGYKARPLNGVWATAPFLHNGAVPTLMDLLSPPEERPAYVELGKIDFDPVKVGLVQDPDLADRVKRGEKYNRDGLFILDTTVPGNGNRGHEFSDAWNPDNRWWNQPRGVIGPALSVAEREAIIEYLKTL